MIDMFKDVSDFHRKFGIDYAGKPRALDFEMLQHRLKFLRQEAGEYETHADACEFILDDKQHRMLTTDDELTALNYHLSESLDALVDLVYVALGTAHLHGFDFNAAWERVHKANMAKCISDSATSSDNKMKQRITKPPGWTAPDHKDLVIDNAHRNA